MIVRPLEPRDHERWVEMRQALLPDKERDDLAELGKLHTPWCVLVAEQGDGSLAGYAHATIRSVVEGVWFEPSAYLEEIYVDDDSRRSGLASKLLDGVIDWAREQGVRHIGSDCNEHNERSRAWHKAAGFDEVEVAVHFLMPIEKRAR